MDDQLLRDASSRALDLVQDLPDDLRPVAFGVLLRSIIQGTSATQLEIAAPTRAAPTVAASLSINELLAKLGASTHVERVTAIAFHTLLADAAGITTKDVNDAYGRARTKKPRNIPDVIGQCVQRGYLIEGVRKDGNKAWVITPTGEAFIESILSAKS